MVSELNIALSAPEGRKRFFQDIPETHLFHLVLSVAKKPFKGGGKGRIKIDARGDLPVRGDIEIPERIFITQGDLSR
jgi:hypothetical protein